jgi:hypothetical protein
MALAALSLAHQNGLHNAYTLEYYQQVISALENTVQSSQDSYSDGTLFTHFTLLLYELSSIIPLKALLDALGILSNPQEYACVKPLANLNT